VRRNKQLFARLTARAVEVLDRARPGNAPASALPSELAGKVVLAFNVGESVRFTPVMKGLSAAFDTVSIGANPRRALKISQCWGGPVARGPCPSAARSRPSTEQAVLEGLQYRGRCCIGATTGILRSAR
jgi:hypothetical protein